MEGKEQVTRKWIFFKQKSRHVASNRNSLCWAYRPFHIHLLNGDFFLQDLKLVLTYSVEKRIGCCVKFYFIRSTHLIRGKCQWKCQNVNFIIQESLVDELYSVQRSSCENSKFISMNFFLIFALPSSYLILIKITLFPFPLIFTTN